MRDVFQSRFLIKNVFENMHVIKFPQKEKLAMKAPRHSSFISGVAAAAAAALEKNKHSKLFRNARVQFKL